MMELYWISGSAPAWRVVLALEYKGLSYESRILERSKKEQKSPWFLALNPRGQIPVLKDGETILSQSLAILHYLEQHTPTPALFGEDSATSAKILQSTYELLSCVDPPINEIVQAVFRNKIEERRDVLGKAAKTTHQELTRLDHGLEGHDWLAGAQCSAADIVMIPTFQRLLRSIHKQPEFAQELNLHNWQEQYPHLARWNERTEAMPAFATSFPPHWKE